MKIVKLTWHGCKITAGATTWRSLAYCLMSNHIHLPAVAGTEEALQAVLKPLHMRCAQRRNRQRGWKGHVWQGRYFSSPLDQTYLWAGFRYVKRNPVRARMLRKAQN